MLENEPTGGETTGTEPVDEATTSSAPTRRRSTRRRTGAESTSTAGTDPATPAAGTDPEVGGESGTAESPVRRTRTRRKAVETDETGESGQEPAPPTRTRRKRAVPAASAEPTEQAVDAGVTATAGDSPAADAAPAGRSSRRGAAANARAAAEPAPSEAPQPAQTADPTAETSTTETAPASGRRRRAPAAASVLFMAPEPVVSPQPAAGRAAKPAGTPDFADHDSAAQSSGAGQHGSAAAVAAEPAADEESDAEGSRASRRRRSRRGTEASAPAEPAVEDETEPIDSDAEAEAAEDDEDDEDDGAGGRRRRRRGRRGRGRGKGPHDEADSDEEAEAEADEDVEAEAGAEADAENGEPLTRRRRRRRRGGSASDGDSTTENGVVTVVKVRQPRAPRDEVQGVSGSTRLEAKRQRRRDGREQRRTRPPILSESEFLARREAVDRTMVVRQKGERTQIAVLEDGVLVEHYVTRASSGSMVGNVYLGKVQNVLPSMEAAFVDIGRGRNAVLYAGEVNWDATGLEGRARSIEQALRSGDSVLVQVTKDPIGHKGARLTSHIALSGRHLVYVPHGNASGISRKLPDTERKRLRDILKGLVPESAGVIVRTAAEGADEDELARDVTRLQAQWDDIQEKSAEGGAPVLLYEEPDLVIRVVRDLFNEDFRELVVQGDEAYDLVEMYLKHVSPDLLTRLRRHTGVGDILAERRIDEQILKGLDRKVFLPSGGTLVIDRTEAMTVIDVNTGKYTGTGGNLEETVTRNNLEAAEEIVRQLRLRDLGGIVVIDFIDMVLESNRELVLRRLTECLGRDRTKHQVTEITSLGLVQMTRKRIGQGLLEAFSETCEHCKGRGVLIHTEPVSEKKPAAKATAAVAAAAPTEPVTASGRRRGRKAAAAAQAAGEAAHGEVESDEANGVAEGWDAEDVEVRPAPEEALPAVVDETDEPDDLVGTEDGEHAGTDTESHDEHRRGRRGGGRRRPRSAAATSS